MSLMSVQTSFSSIIQEALFSSSALLFKKIPFILPDIGEGITEVEVLEWKVNIGDEVEEMDNLCDVQSDKANVEITSPLGGTVTKLFYNVGDIAKVGTPLIEFDSTAETEGEEEEEVEEAEPVKEEVVEKKVEKVVEENVDLITYVNRAELDDIKPKNLDSIMKKEAKYVFNYNPKEIDVEKEKTSKINLFTAINHAMDEALEEDEKTILFGEDVKFGGVFRCSLGLNEKYGDKRVFNTPLSEQGIAGFAVGVAAQGYRPITEIQFADYIFPAFDQIVNEAAKFRYRSGGTFDVSGLTIRTPCGAVGHGGHYHSQSSECYFSHCAGLRIVVPRNPLQAKGLLRACINNPDPCLFFEPKILYRSSVCEVPDRRYELPLDKADILKQGTDITLVGYGTQLYRLEQAVDMAEELGISCELIDLRTIVPFDEETILKSVQKTGRLLISHEASFTTSMASELAATVQEKAFLHLKAPIARVTGLDTPFPMVHEKYFLPDPLKVFEVIKQTVNF